MNQNQNLKLTIHNQPVSQLETYDNIAVISFSGKGNGPYEIQGILNFISTYNINIDMLMCQNGYHSGNRRQGFQSAGQGRNTVLPYYHFGDFHHSDN